MLPVYSHEPSSLNPLGMITDFAPRLIGRSMYRVFMSYFMRDFNVVSLFFMTGLPALSFGVVWSVYYWIQSVRLQTFASTGTVMIGVLAIVLGFQLILRRWPLMSQMNQGGIDEVKVVLPTLVY